MSKTSHTSNSPYRDLYRSIEKMRIYGTQNNDLRMVELATTLKQHLIKFEANPNTKNLESKNKFRVQFLATLHREDKAFHKQSNPTKPFLGAIYKALYIGVFGIQKMSSLSLFAQEKNMTENVVEPKKGFSSF